MEGSVRVLALAVILALPLCAGAFRASAVKVDITPKNPQWLMGYGARQSTGVHDPIFHRIAALEDGTTQFYLVSSDLCLFSPSVYDAFAKQLEKQTGITARQVWWSVTHTHSAPEVGPPDIYKVLLGRSDHEWDRQYNDLVVGSLIQGIKDSRARLEPARLGIGTGMSMANINRRARDVSGAISLGLNPDGPVDRQIGLIRLERLNGSLIGLIANYAMHGTVMSGQNLQISGDGPGTVAAYVEEKLGAPMLYINGAAGNIAPIYSVYPDPKSGHLAQFNVLLGDRILEAGRNLGGSTSDVALWVGEKMIETPRKSGLDWPAELSRYAAAGPAGAMVRLPVRFAKINDTLLWAAPVELFCEIATRVRNESPFPRTFYFGYTNGWFGYLPTAQAFGEGGYEPKTSPFTAQAERDLTEAVITFVHSLSR